MPYFTLPDFGALAAKVPPVIRRHFSRRKAATANAARADEIAKAEAARAVAVAIAEAEATQDARLKAVFVEFCEALVRLEAKLDAILAKLE